jgi:hypothetical protein
MAFTPSPITLCTTLEGGLSAGPVASDSRVFFRDLFQRHIDMHHHRFKKALKNLAFLSYRRACKRVLLSIMKICSIIVISQSRLLIRSITLTHPLFRTRPTKTPRPTSSQAPRGTFRHDDGFFHKYQDRFMSLEPSRDIHAV